MIYSENDTRPQYEFYKHMVSLQRAYWDVAFAFWSGQMLKDILTAQVAIHERKEDGSKSH